MSWPSGDIGYKFYHRNCTVQVVVGLDLKTLLV